MLTVLILIAAWVYYFSLNHPDAPTLKIPFDKVHFKTGDIILFHALDNMSSLMIGTYYTHIGVVLELGGRPMLFEAVSPETETLVGPNQNGIVLCDLDTRLKTYRGHILYKAISRAPDVDIEAFVQYCIQNCHYNTAVFSNFLNKVIFGDPLMHGLNCGELAYLTLIKLGVLPEEYFHRNRRHHLAWLAELDYVPETGYSWHKKKYVKYDPFGQLTSQKARRGKD